MERRTLEFRAETTGRGLRGHAAVFDQEAQIREFWERIERRAFDRVLREKQDVVLQVDHQGLPLARTASGTLQLRTDSVGLEMYTPELPDTQLGRDVRTLVERGDLVAMSFGFQVAEDEWSLRQDGTQLRSIREIGRLFDVSVVTFPAYAGTDVALRSEQISPPKIARVTARDQAARIRARLWKASS